MDEGENIEQRRGIVRSTVHGSGGVSFGSTYAYITTVLRSTTSLAETDRGGILKNTTIAIAFQD